MEALVLQTGAPVVHWEDNTIFIYVVEAKIVTPRVKQIDIPVYFLQEILENVIFVPKFEKYSVMSENIFTKPCLGSIIYQTSK